MTAARLNAPLAVCGDLLIAPSPGPLLTPRNSTPKRTSVTGNISWLSIVAFRRNGERYCRTKEVTLRGANVKRAGSAPSATRDRFRDSDVSYTAIVRGTSPSNFQVASTG